MGVFTGHCTDNLSLVLKLSEEPWIDPDGATANDIINTIKKCPSGALGYTVDDIEHRDQDRSPMVTVTKDGPYAVTGGIEIVDQPLGEGASTEHFTLCRCGGSKNKPFCDGTHWPYGALRVFRREFTRLCPVGIHAIPPR